MEGILRVVNSSVGGIPSRLKSPTRSVLARDFMQGAVCLLGYTFGQALFILGIYLGIGYIPDSDSLRLMLWS